jgi:hypothetical protein
VVAVLPVEPHPALLPARAVFCVCGLPGHAMSTDPMGKPAHAADENTLARLAAIEAHVHQIETRLSAINEFNTQLDEIHTALEAVIGFVTPGRITESFTDPGTHVDRTTTGAGFRVVAHVSRDSAGMRLASDISWPDTWSVRLFVTALLRNLARNDHAHKRRQCWCEVWTPNETGERVDSAVLNPDTGIIEWESDMIDTRTAASRRAPTTTDTAILSRGSRGLAHEPNQER